MANTSANIKNDFPIFRKNPDLVYLDSACTSLKPRQVIDAEIAYYTEIGACGGRSSHKLGRETSTRIEEAREKVAGFVGAKGSDLVWTRNTTEGLNLVINGFDYSKRPKVVTTILEHHAVLLPLMNLRDEGRIKLEIVKCKDNGEVDLDSWTAAIDKDTALVVTNNGNNTSGWNQDARKIASIAHDSGAFICIDGAQGVPHRRSDIKRDGIDFLCFSGHKMLGPTGIGALVGRKELIMGLKPLVRGGGTVKTVSTREAIPMSDNTFFEAGVQHYSGIIGFAAACDYLKKFGMDRVEAHEKTIAAELQREIDTADALIYGPDKPTEHGAIYAFNLKKAKPHEVALMLDKQNIAVRSGFFCAQPAMEALGAKEGAVRASGYIYNTLDDVKKFGEALQKIRQIY